MRSGSTLRKWQALLEPLVLLVASALLARVVLERSGYSRGAANDAIMQATGPLWGTATKAFLVVLVVRWGMLLLAAGWLARWRGYSALHPVDDTGRWPLWKGIMLGIAVGAVLVFPSAFTRYAHFVIRPLGTTPAVWELMNRVPWTASFWVYMAVSSFALVPIVEEIFFRGYVLGALNLLFERRTAILLSAVLFCAVHGQYLRPDAFSVFNSAMVLAGGVVLAWLVYTTRSLVPAMAEHAFANLPRSPRWIVLDGVAALAGAIVVYALLRAGRREINGRL